MPGRPLQRRHWSQLVNEMKGERAPPTLGAWTRRSSRRAAWRQGIQGVGELKEDGGGWWNGSQVKKVSQRGISWLTDAERLQKATGRGGHQTALVPEDVWLQ